MNKMNKPLCVISCPIDCYSGYSSRSRDIVKVLIESDKYEVKILSQRWGNCTQGFLQEDNPDHKKIIDCILQVPQLPKKPDLWIQITVPNEMQRIGNYNILITAGIETDICAPDWIRGMNQADLVIVSSNHSKNVFTNTKFEKVDNNTKQVIESLQCSTPIEVLFEGSNNQIYYKSNEKFNSKLTNQLDEIQENFCYLFVGHYLSGDFGADRKNVGQLIRTFLDTFKDIPNPPALVLKTNGASTSIMDRDEILSKINKIKSTVQGKLPNIYLLHGEFSDEEMNELYNHPKVKIFVSFTKGEGFGRPLLESSLYQKPIICPYYSGQIDFLKKDFIIPLPGALTQIHQSAVIDNMLLKEGKWFEVDVKQASIIFKNSFKNYKDYLDLAKRQSYFSKTNFTLDKMGEKLLNILETRIPEQKEFKLPKLIRI